MTVVFKVEECFEFRAVLRFSCVDSFRASQFQTCTDTFTNGQRDARAENRKKNSVVEVSRNSSCSLLLSGQD